VNSQKRQRGQPLENARTIMMDGNGKQHGGDGLPYLWDVDNPGGYANRMGRYRTRVESDFLFRHLADSPLRILDVGGGSGRLGGMLASRGHHVTLIDKNPEAIALAKEKGIQRAVVCDIADFHEGNFDCAVCMEVIEYFEDCSHVISKANQFLKIGGTFVFCVLNSKSWRFRLRALSNDGFNANAFTIEEIERCLKRHGFEVTERQGFQWSLARTASDSVFVDISALIEKSLGLQKWLAQSPWLLYACRKVADAAA
jgi:2-polyprenyl-3-methyl-5-hydroxy-6-metoxy-1,4-benzoquinol methylase